MRSPSQDLLFSPSPKLVQSIHARMQMRLNEHKREPKYKGYPLPDLPSEKYVEELLKIAFWASFEREEGRELRFSLAFSRRAKGTGYYPLSTPIPLSRESIRKLAIAYERTTTHFGVQASKRKLYIWGGLQYPGDGIFVVDAIEPGTLAVRYTPETIGMLKGDSTTFLPAGHVHRMPAGLVNLLVRSFSKDIPEEDAFNTAILLIDLARKIRLEGHGGLILAVPSQNESWRESLEERYSIDPQYDQSSDKDALDARPGRGRLSEILSFQMRHPFDSQERYIELARKLSDIREGAQERLARLALVDGALVITTERRVVGFGARLIRSRSHSSSSAVEGWDPIANISLGRREVRELGGTRHQSAANFVGDNPGSLALVISQDGRVSVLTRSDQGSILFIPGVEVLFL